jgi:hypothetical protein
MKHCNDPDHCSLCSGSPAKHVTIVDGSIVVDGVDTGRRTERVQTESERKRRRRGGRR